MAKRRVAKVKRPLPAYCGGPSPGPGRCGCGLRENHEVTVITGPAAGYSTYREFGLTVPPHLWADKDFMRR